MRQVGAVPAATSLWAVANPNTEPNLDTLRRKIDAGAEVVLTQPPLDAGAFDAWVQMVDNHSLSQQVRLVIGMPMLTSASSTAFWVSLCSAWRRHACRQLVQEFRAAEQGQAQSEFDEWCRQWNENLIRKVRDMPGMGGFHIMPLNAKSRKMALAMVQSGLLTQQEI